MMIGEFVYTLVLGCDEYLFPFEKSIPLGEILTGTFRYFSIGYLIQDYSGIYSMLFFIVN